MHAHWLVVMECAVRSFPSFNCDIRENMYCGLKHVKRQTGFCPRREAAPSTLTRKIKYFLKMTHVAFNPSQNAII
jgi:hypothetical protein